MRGRRRKGRGHHAPSKVPLSVTREFKPRSLSEITSKRRGRRRERTPHLDTSREEEGNGHTKGKTGEKTDPKERDKERDLTGQEKKDQVAMIMRRVGLSHT